MKLELFHFIEDTIEYFDRNLGSYEYVEGRLKQLYAGMLTSSAGKVVTFSSRIKSKESLKEKLIRNRFYLDYDTPQEAINHLSDLIGITLQCRFIRNEHELYESLFEHFEQTDENFAVCKEDSTVYLNLKMPQPQTQRNGFTIYRLDGYCMFSGRRVNYELQIKSLVHNFWSEIEHEVVYKNPDFVMYDSFNQAMLGAIRDNLDVVDRQLEIMYNEISEESRQAQIGMNERGFKTFVSRSINELVNRKMKESFGFATDFKKCSAMISQYIYIRDFINGTNNQVKMIDYLSLLNYLNETEIDFSERIDLGENFVHTSPFCQIVGNYFIEQFNVNFQWHVFFAMLFQIQPGNNMEDFMDFCEFLKILVIQPTWFTNTFTYVSSEERTQVHHMLESELAECIVRANKIEIVHEDKLFECMNIFRHIVDEYNQLCMNAEEVNFHAGTYCMKIRREIGNVFA